MYFRLFIVAYPLILAAAVAYWVYEDILPTRAPELRKSIRSVMGVDSLARQKPSSKQKTTQGTTQNSSAQSTQRRPPQASSRSTAARTARKHAIRGSRLLEKGNYTKAATEFEEALRFIPDEASYHNALSVVYHHLKEYNKSFACITEAIRLGANDPDLARYYNFRGFLYYQTLKYDKAIADYTMAIKHAPAPENADYYYNRGILHKLKEEYGKAAEDFEAVLNEPAHDHHEQARKNLEEVRKKASGAETEAEIDTGLSELADSIFGGSAK